MPDAPDVTPESIAEAKRAAEDERQRDGVICGPDGKLIVIHPPQGDAGEPV